MENELNIGMAFSGGGYRAATFDLGTLSFLNSIRLEDGRTLLSCVTALTSVSGGTIPAMKYMLALAKGQSIDEMIHELFDFLCNEDLVTHALNGISAEKANRDASSIKIMAGIYDKYLFKGATMGDIIDSMGKDTDNKDRKPIPVKDYTALATDFDNSLPFRFRVTYGYMTTGERISYGVFGNSDHYIGRDVARHITPGEALACSSCFPSGFEPMMYPDDFQVSQQPDIASTIKSRFGLMDGGVVDNQGIDPLLLAEERLRSHRKDQLRTDKAFDLVIISDVAGSETDGYDTSEQMLPQSVGRLTLGRLRNYGLISEAVVMILFLLALAMGNGFWLGVITVILAIVTLLNVIGALFKNKIFKAIGSTFIGDRARFLSHLKFATAEAMLMNRAKSIIMMSSEVFLHQLRRKNYDSIYENNDWHNRRITSTIYELSPSENKRNGRKQTKRKWEYQDVPVELKPSEAIQRNSKLAASMGTTLWFTAEDKAAGMPQALLATGQYNTCYNLLDYINRIEKDPSNTTPAHQLIIACKPQLEEAWKKFQTTPQWMVPKTVGCDVATRQQE
jgi:hypothetical protein